MITQEEIRKSYNHYLKWYAEPGKTLTYEEFEKREIERYKEKQKENEIIMEIASKITVYSDIVNRFDGPYLHELEDQLYMTYRKHYNELDEKCHTAHFSGDKELALGYARQCSAHRAAFLDAYNRVRSQRKAQGKRRPIVAENVYDDDKPTTHHLYF